MTPAEQLRDEIGRLGLRVLVCGGRDYINMSHVFDVLDEIHANTEIKCIIHGGCNLDQTSVFRRVGADVWADDWARDRGVQPVVYTALWEEFGTSAGPRRNQQMIDEGKPDLVVAFPGGKGTADMCRRAEKAGIPIRKEPRP